MFRIGHMSRKPKTANPIDLPAFQEDHTTVMDRQSERVQPPKMYRVVLLNDDFTPMEFVVMVIQEYFHHDQVTRHSHHVTSTPRRKRGLWCIY